MIQTAGFVAAVTAVGFLVGVGMIAVGAVLLGQAYAKAAKDSLWKP